METVFLGFQVRSLDPLRFPERPAGRVSGEALRRLEATVRYCLGL
jgi:mRNA interferase MazF